MQRDNATKMNHELSRSLFWKRIEKIKKLIATYRNHPTYLIGRNSRDQSLFTWAIINGQFDIALSLTQCEGFVIPPNELNFEFRGHCLLSWMVANAGNNLNEYNNDAIARLLKYPGINVNIRIDVYPILFYPLREGNNDLLRILLQHPTASTTLSTPHHNLITTAIKIGDLDRLRILLECDKLNVNMTHEKHGTALMTAARQNDIEAVKILLSHKAIDVSIEHKGVTALEIAARKGNATIVRLLLDKYGDNLKSSDPMIVKIVQNAAANNKVDVLHAFIDKNLDKGVDLYTWSVDEKHESITKRLPVTENPPPRLQPQRQTKSTTASLTSRMSATPSSSSNTYNTDDSTNNTLFMMMLASQASYMANNNDCHDTYHGGYDHGSSCHDTGTTDYGGGCDSGGSTYSPCE